MIATTAVGLNKTLLACMTVCTGDIRSYCLGNCYLAKKVRVMILLRNFHLSPTESVLQRSVVLQGDGDRSQAEPHRHCECGLLKPTEHHVQLRLDLDV